MFKKNVFKKISKIGGKGGEEKMKKLCLLLAVSVLLLGLNSVAFAQQTIGVAATVTSGVSLPSTKLIRKCSGTLTASEDPFTSAKCSDASTTGITFGTLLNTLPDGTDADTLPDPAGCFYDPDFFIVYLYPAAWGGLGYTVSQTFTWSPTGIGNNSLVLSSVYSPQDRFSATGPIQGAKPTGSFVGASTNTADLVNSQAAAGGGAKQIYKSEKPGQGVIIRAQYGLPPYPDTTKGETIPFTGWVPVDLKTAAAPYSGNVVITIASY